MVCIPPEAPVMLAASSLSCRALALCPRAFAASAVRAATFNLLDARIAAQPCTPHLVGGASCGPVRRFGVMDSIRGSLDRQKDKKMTEKREELFRAQITFLTSVPQYTMVQHLVQLQDSAKAAGISGWKSKLRSTDEQAELEAQFAEVKVGEALTPEELQDYKLVDRRAKLRIGAQLGMDVSKVNKFLQNYEEMLNMHAWLRSRATRGLPVPTNPMEYQVMMMEDPSGASRKQMQKNMGRVRSARSLYR